MKKRFRAFYKPDLKTPDGAIRFEQKEINDELWFAVDKNLKYQFYIPFMDDNWDVQQYLGLVDMTGFEICEGDILEDTIAGKAVEISYNVNEGIFWGSWNSQRHILQYLDQCKVVGNIYETPQWREIYGQ